eukprot:5630101-Amphidinium_carterae.3
MNLKSRSYEPALLRVFLQAVSKFGLCSRRSSFDVVKVIRLHDSSCQNTDPNAPCNPKRTR